MALSTEVKHILTIVRKSGEFLKKLSQDPRNRQPQVKADGSPVTPADLAVSALLVEELSGLGYPIVSEEALPETPPDGSRTLFFDRPLGWHQILFSGRG